MPNSERPGSDRVRAAMEEILGWQGLARSPQLAQLLRYVVEKTLAGEGASIKAYSIAVDVFGRPPDFDPQADPIVRVQARRLRTLLEQFYAAGLSREPVQIHLPLGRYEPDFITVAQPIANASATPSSMDSAPPPRRRISSRFLINAFLGLLFTLVGVSLAIALIRLLPPERGDPSAMVPDFPIVSIGTFDNLTGQQVLDDDIAEIGPKLATALGRFEGIIVGSGGDGAIVSGAVQEQDGRFILKAIITSGDGIEWSTTINAPTGGTDTSALAGATTSLAAQMAGQTGPLHAPGRAWLRQQNALPEIATPYVCMLQFMRWRDTRNLDAADTGLACFDQLLTQDANDPVALASDAAMRAWRIQYVAIPGTDVAASMQVTFEASARAVELRPNSSFVNELNGLTLVRGGKLAEAISAGEHALALNQASADTRAMLGTMYWLAGDYDRATDTSETAIAQIVSPPPWYYTTRSFEAMREQRYFDAVEAALALAQGDDELGPIIALAAAPRISRNDLIDRFRPIVLGNPHLQSSGIFPRLATIFRPEALANRIRDGLVLAGIPRHALDAPFNADGTPKT